MGWGDKRVESSSFNRERKRMYNNKRSSLSFSFSRLQNHRNTVCSGVGERRGVDGGGVAIV